MRVLIAVDESQNAEAACLFYLENLHKESHEVQVITCWEYGTNINSVALEAMTVEQFNANVEALRKKSCRVNEHYVELMKKFCRGAQVRIVRDVCAGKRIVQEAETWKADLIVMGSRGQGAIQTEDPQALFGSVSRFVLRNALCQVVVCKPKEGGEATPREQSPETDTSLETDAAPDDSTTADVATESDIGAETEDSGLVDREEANDNASENP